MTYSLLFVAPSAYTLGGVQTWLDYLIPGLDGNGFKTTIALANGEQHDAEKYLEHHPFNNVYFVDNPTGSSTGRMRALEKTIAELKPNVIVVVNIADVYQAVNNLRRAASACNTKVITSIHGIHPGIIQDIHRYSAVIDSVITTNRLTQELVMRKTDMENDRVFYAPYGVPPIPPSFTRKTTPSAYTIVYVGRLDEDQKRINDLLEIFTLVRKSIENVRLLIAGDGCQRVRVEQWVAEQDDTSNITYFGTLSTEELREQVYAVADVMLITSHWETGPIVAWEAFSHGLTVVTSRYIGCDEEGSLKDGENCLIFEIGDIACAVAKLCQANDPKFRAQLVRNAQELIDNRYSLFSSVSAWAKQISKTLTLEPKPYQQIARQSIDAGRLSTIVNRLFGETGLRCLDSLKRLFRIRFQPPSPGGEWPHTHSDLDSRSTSLNAYIEREKNNGGP